MAISNKYRSTVRKATLAAGAIGVPGAFSFGADVAAMSTTWIAMIKSIANKSGHAIDNAYAVKLAGAVLAGVGAYVGGSKIAMKFLHLIPGAGTLAAIGVNSSLNALFTYKMGHALSKTFDQKGLDSSNATEMTCMLLSLVACLPTFHEFNDLYHLMRNDNAA